MVNAFIHLTMELEDIFSLLNQVFEFFDKDIHIYTEHDLSSLYNIFISMILILWSSFCHVNSVDSVMKRFINVMSRAGLKCKSY